MITVIPTATKKPMRIVTFLSLAVELAGLMAALQAANGGARVILADEQNEFGGWLLGEANISIDEQPATTGIGKMTNQLQQCQM